METTDFKILTWQILMIGLAVFIIYIIIKFLKRKK